MPNKKISTGYKEICKSLQEKHPWVPLTYDLSKYFSDKLMVSSTSYC